MLGQDRDVDLEDAVRLVRGVGDERAVVRALDLGDARVLDVRVEIAGADVRVVGDRGHREAPRVADVLGRRGLAVGPLHPVADVVRDLVGGPLPRVGEARAGRRVEVEVGQQVVRELERLVADDEIRVERVRGVEILGRADGEHHRVGGRGGRGGWQQRRECEHERGHRPRPLVALGQGHRGSPPRSLDGRPSSGATRHAVAGGGFAERGTRTGGRQPDSRTVRGTGRVQSLTGRRSGGGSPRAARGGRSGRRPAPARTG